MALAGRVIASHYARPVERRLGRSEPLRATPSADGEGVAELAAGEPFLLLDDSLGWAWGYGGPERLVGYVSAEALAPASC